MLHQSYQQSEQKYENKREKSGSEVENSLKFILSQVCESSLTCSSPTSSKRQGEERGAESEPRNISSKMSLGERTVTGRKREKGRRRGA